MPLAVSICDVAHSLHSFVVYRFASIDLRHTMLDKYAYLIYTLRSDHNTRFESKAPSSDDINQVTYSFKYLCIIWFVSHT